MHDYELKRRFYISIILRIAVVFMSLFFALELSFGNKLFVNFFMNITAVFLELTYRFYLALIAFCGSISAVVIIVSLHVILVICFAKISSSHKSCTDYLFPDLCIPVLLQSTSSQTRVEKDRLLLAQSPISTNREHASISGEFRCFIRWNWKKKHAVQGTRPKRRGNWWLQCKG